VKIIINEAQVFGLFNLCLEKDLDFTFSKLAMNWFMYAN